MCCYSCFITFIACVVCSK